MQLAVHDLRGRLVRTLVDGQRPAGDQQVRWQGVDNGGRPVASGVYVVRLQAHGTVETRSLAVLR
ncbi:MAG: FlgD immunoglobulin-like domain containing protein [Candidatus Krumholzibacteriia bacterium]